MTVLRSRFAFLCLAVSLVLPRCLEAGFAGSDVFIAASARAGGFGGSEFYSTLWITNLGPATANLQLDFLRQGQPNPAPVTRTDTLAPGATRRYENVVEQLFGISGAGGAVRVRANQEVFVSSRTYDRPPGTELKDVKGLFFAGIPASFAIGLGEVSRLQGVTHGPLENFRYNFGLVEVTGQAVTVAVRLKDESGTVTGTQQYDLGAYEARQVNGFLGFSPAVSTTDALLEAQIVGGAGKVLFYGTQIAGTATVPGSNDSAGFEMSFKGSLLASPGVTSLNGLLGALTLVAGGPNVTVTPSGSTITIAAAAGGLTLPYGQTVNLETAAFSVTNTVNVGVYGKSGSSRGVWGVGGSYGVYGEGNEGVHGAGAAVGVLGAGPTGVIGLGGSGGIGVRGQNGGGSGLDNVQAGVYGDSGGSYGVYGNSSSGVGVIGNSNSHTGVKGLTTSHDSDHAGVYGFAYTDAVGVRGESSSGHGVSGSSASSAGVYGSSSSGEGVWGVAKGFNTGAGVLGTNDAGGVGIGVYGRARANSNRGGFFDGGITVVNGGKSFVEPHPTDPTKEIRYVALEGPESGTYFRGASRTVGGFATIEVPESFRMVTDERGLTVGVTPVGELAVIACMRLSLTEILIQSSRDVEFHYMVNGVRKGFADFEPIEENTFFIPASPNDPALTRPLPQETLARLISNGTLNADGSVNMDTVRRLGWDRRQAWKDRGEPARAASGVPASRNEP